jgi:hypothetical protein
MGIWIVHGQSFDSSGCIETIISRKKDQRSQTGGLKCLVRHESRGQLYCVIGPQRVAFQEITRLDYDVQVQLDKLVFGSTVGCKCLNRDLAVIGWDRPFPSATRQRAGKFRP